MSEADDKKIRELLKAVIPPVTDRRVEGDLWPAMRRRLAKQPAPMTWFDWALLAVLAIWFFFFPEAIPLLLYHL